MLDTDFTIIEILQKAKKEGNPILKYFKISYPKEELAMESNCIFVACVSSENNLNGFEFETFKDLVEIVVTTKKQDNTKAIQVIKTISKEICRVIMENHNCFPNKPVIRNINPYFNPDYVLTRGQIMIQVNTEPTDFIIEERDIKFVCKNLQGE